MYCCNNCSTEWPRKVKVKDLIEKLADLDREQRERIVFDDTDAG